MFAWINQLDHYLPIRYARLGTVRRRPSSASAIAWWQMGMSLWLVARLPGPRRWSACAT